MLSDQVEQFGSYEEFTQVLMHLMALGAFRQIMGKMLYDKMLGLNAPYGARCFPTCER